MNQENVYSLFKSLFTKDLKVELLNGGFNIKLPFIDYMGDPIEITLTSKEDKLILDDLGHTAGILFHLNQHSEEAPGHVLIKNLAEAYQINMDYDRGILSQEIALESGVSSALDFIKVLISSHTVLTEMQRQKKRSRTGRRLGTRLGRDIKQLRLPQYVQRHVEIEGKHETWVVDYKYGWKRAEETKDILIVAVDLGRREPRLKAEHVLTLAVDVLQLDHRRDLRVIYDVNGNGSGSAAHRAASLIYDYQYRIGYKAYNYSDPEQKNEITALTLQELSPLIFSSDS